LRRSTRLTSPPVATLRLLAEDWTGRHVQAVHGPAHLTWTEAGAVLSTATGLSIEAQLVSHHQERADLRQAGLSEVAVEGIIGMGVGERDGFIPEQPRSVLTTTPSTGWLGDHASPSCAWFKAPRLRLSVRRSEVLRRLPSV
jgi:hypothetical protein